MFLRQDDSECASAYQRSYAWEHEHVEALLNDINEAIRNKEHEYFLGSVVVTGPCKPDMRLLMDNSDLLRSVY